MREYVASSNPILAILFLSTYITPPALALSFYCICQKGKTKYTFYNKLG